MFRHKDRLLLTTFATAALLLASACGGSDSTPEAPAATPDKPGTATPAAGGVTEPLGSASITGTVRFEGDAPKPRPIKMDADPGCAAKHSGSVMSEALVLGEGQTMANVLVRVKGGLPDATFAAPSEPVVMDQQGCRYVPHVMGVMAGQPFKILNSDGLLHNVHSLPDVNKGFNRAMPANQTEAEFKFDKVEDPFKIKCDVHPWMAAYVAVMDHPYFSVSATDGKFEISGLPAGTYEIEAWHERLGTRTASVTVGDGETASADFSFSRS